MVEPFAAAAFALAEGGTSDLVETQFGLHIIRCIERKEAEVVPFETALPAVRRLLFQSKLGEVRGPYLAKLREEAEVVEH
jgi:parvulin-like peptidyl-prolyl isomerase